MGKYETTISGAAITSTLNQMSMIGDIGKEILKKFGIKKINLSKEYSFKIRGAIHSETRKRFGKDALYFYGLTMMDGYKKVRQAQGGFQTDIFYKKYYKDIHNKNTQIARKFRNKFFEVFSTELGDMTKKTIFTPIENVVGTTIKIIDKDKIELSLTNAVLLENEIFNRGMLTDLLTLLNSKWKFILRFVKSKSKQDSRGWCKFTWEVEFNLNEDKVNPFEKQKELRDDAKQKFIDNVLMDSNRLRKQSDLLAIQLGKFIPPQMHKEMMNGNFSTEITTRRKKLTIFFSDIKNFTDTSEKLQPEDLTKYLNEYFSEMTKIALEYGATIDKYIGDAVMLFFGDPSSKGEKEDAIACVEMSLKMQEKMAELKKKWLDEGFQNPFEIRVGINTGFCNVGNFGSEQRLTYTIIGGEVNIAARLETAGDAGKILMSNETYSHVKDIVNVKELNSIKMKGVSRDVKVFEVISRKSTSTEAIKKYDRNTELTNKKIEDLNNKIEAIDKQFNVLKKLINDLNKQTLN